MRTFALGLLLTLTVRGYAADVDEVRRYLNAQPVIRVGLTVAPHMGHPSVTATVVRRLRQIGFTGQIEVIFRTEGQNHDIVYRLAKVFPEFDPVLADAQTHPDLKIAFFSAEYVRHHPARFPLIELGIMGADDFGVGPEFLNVETMPVVQPMGWSHPAQMRTWSHLGLSKEPLETLDRIPFWLEFPDRDRVATQLSADPTRQTAGLLAMIERLDARDFGAYYGHGLRQDIHQLTTYLGAIALAQRAAPETFARGVVVPVLTLTNRYDVEALVEYLRVSPLERRVRVIDVTSPDLNPAMDQLSADQILVVIANGYVPRPMFELLFHQSRVPPVVGGLNSINLMAQYGRPYFVSNSYEPHHFDLIDPTPLASPARARIVEASNLLRRGLVADARAAHGAAEFLIEARDPRSAVARYFDARRSRTGPHNDRLVRALVEVMRASAPRQTQRCDLALTQAAGA